MLSRASAREMERDCDTPFTTSTSAPLGGGGWGGEIS
jgi:hypothetical protein